MTSTWSAVLCLAVVVHPFLACSDDSGVNPTAPEVGIAGDDKLVANIEFVRSQNNLPALAAIMVRGDQIVEVAAVGVRATGYPEQVTVNDRWHIGSITKSMTATVAAVLVERGAITWETTIGEVFPDLVAGMRAEYRNVRLDELLSHTSGLRRDADYRSHADQSPVTDQRRRLTADVLQSAPVVPRGTHLYSNAGYVVAGAMLEAVTGRSWEQLMQSDLFAPLGMVATGFGAPGTAGRRDEPWGHSPTGASWSAIDPGNTFADNAPLLGPAGTVHGPMSDLARYLSAHLAGARGTGGLITKESFQKLHTVVPGTYYALGWVLLDDGVLWHNGSNTRWYAEAIIAPQIDAAFFVVTNAGPLDGLGLDRAERGVRDLVRVLEQRFRAAFGAN